MGLGHGSRNWDWNRDLPGACRGRASDLDDDTAGVVDSLIKNATFIYDTTAPTQGLDHDWSLTWHEQLEWQRRQRRQKWRRGPKLQRGPEQQRWHRRPASRHARTPPSEHGGGARRRPAGSPDPRAHRRAGRADLPGAPNRGPGRRGSAGVGLVDPARTTGGPAPRAPRDEVQPQRSGRSGPGHRRRRPLGHRGRCRPGREAAHAGAAHRAGKGRCTAPRDDRRRRRRGTVLDRPAPGSGRGGGSPNG